LVRPCVQNVPETIREASPAGYHSRERGPEQNYLRWLLIVTYFKSSFGCCPATLPNEKAVITMDEGKYTVF